jgi:hypothetical protein
MAAAPRDLVMALRRRSIVLSYSLSGLLHAGLAIGLLLAGIPALWGVSTAPIDTAVRTSSPSSTETLPLSELSADESDGDTDRPTLEGKDALAQVNPTEGGLAEFTRQQLQRARERLADRPVDEQTRELEALARRLSNVSSGQSVEQLSDALAPWLGVDQSRATEPAEAQDEEPFDPETAQVSDVLKQQTGESVQYVAVLVDAKGRTLETPLDEADGEALYDVFVLMRKFPLLEAVYRKTVMGLLDKLIEEQPPEDPSQPSGNESDPQQNEQQDRGAAPGAG